MEYETSLLLALDRGAGFMSFRFLMPAGLEYRGGQFFLLRLDEKLMKPFSFSSSPTEAGYFELTTKMSGSDYKSRLASLKEGDKVRVTGPMGKFTYAGQKKLAFLAGGIGITPFRSMMKSLAASGADCDVVLLWGVNAMEDAIFKDDFDGMASAGKRIRAVYVPAKPPAGWTGPSGFIDRAIISSQIPDHAERAFYVCGPPKMVEVMGGLLAGMGVASDRLVVEQFGGY